MELVIDAPVCAVRGVRCGHRRVRLRTFARCGVVRFCSFCTHRVYGGSSVHPCCAAAERRGEERCAGCDIHASGEFRPKKPKHRDEFDEPRRRVRLDPQRVERMVARYREKGLSVGGGYMLGERDGAA